MEETYVSTKRKPEEVLKQYFGYDSFREGQKPLIEAVLAGRDVLGIMPTGAGKSLCFQIPALMLEGVTLVISPLISLMKDQVSALNQAGIHAAFLNSSLTAGQYRLALERARQGAYKIIYVAPERLETEGFLRFALAPEVRISFLAVDESHCVSQWGQDFRPSYLKILNFLEQLPKRPVIGAYTATATAEVRDDILDILRLENPLVTTTGFDRENLFFAVRHPADKYRELVSYLKGKLKKDPHASGIVYCLTRKNVEEVCFRLREDGFSVTRYHAGLGDSERQENQEDFIYDRRQLMVATNAFGMGIDKPDVRFVIHYGMPKNMESYYQEAGRAGRDGEPAECVLLYGPADVRMNQLFIEHNEENDELDALTREIVQERDRERLKKMTFYCFTSECLRNYILGYFGERSSSYCGNCLNCRTQYETVDITRESRAVVQCVESSGQRFGLTLILETLKGMGNQRIRQRGLDKNPAYGSLGTVTQARIRQIMNELVMGDYLAVTQDEYPVVKLTARSREIFEETFALTMKLAVERPEGARLTAEGTQQAAKGRSGRRRAGAVAALSERDAAVFEALRRLRAQIAAEERVPPYVVFSDKTLAALAAERPESEEDMLNISGIGTYKCEKYGSRFLAELSRFPQDTAAANI